LPGTRRKFQTSTFSCLRLPPGSKSSRSRYPARSQLRWTSRPPLKLTCNALRLHSATAATGIAGPDQRLSFCAQRRALRVFCFGNGGDAALNWHPVAACERFFWRGVQRPYFPLRDSRKRRALVGRGSHSGTRLDGIRSHTFRRGPASQPLGAFSAVHGRNEFVLA